MPELEIGKRIAYEAWLSEQVAQGRAEHVLWMNDGSHRINAHLIDGEPLVTVESFEQLPPETKVLSSHNIAQELKNTGMIRQTL